MGISGMNGKSCPGDQQPLSLATTSLPGFFEMLIIVKYLKLYAAPETPSRSCGPLPLVRIATGYRPASDGWVTVPASLVF